ncbi:MAG: hypothetical protein PHY31_00150 [Smithellaceae bacterium]|nr:hypothetical protein [Smithellaceae bacterium]
MISFCRGKTYFISLLVTFLALFFIWSCNHRGATTTPEEGPLALRRVAIIPFEQVLPSGGSKAIRCPVCGVVSWSDEITPNSEETVEAMFTEQLKTMAKTEIMGQERVMEAYSQIADVAVAPGPELYKRLGMVLGADAIVIGNVYRFRERKGYAYSVMKPASVSYDIHLIRTSDGRMLWRGGFDRTQTTLFEDLSQISFFIKNRGRWLTAEELARSGMDDVMKTFPAIVAK